MKNNQKTIERNKSMKGKTYEELYGVDKANLIKQKQKLAYKNNPLWEENIINRLKKDNIGFKKGNEEWRKRKRNSGWKLNQEVREKISLRNSGEKNYFWKGGKIEKTCPSCGNIFKKHLGNIDKNINSFCSKRCYSEWMHINNNGENHPNWRGGKSFEPYSKEFNEVFKEAIKIRDNESCVICNSMDILDVHHIDYNKLNSSKENCISLCHYCHPKTNFNRKYWQEFFQSMLKDRYGYIYAKLNLKEVKNENIM